MSDEVTPLLPGVYIAKRIAVRVLADGTARIEIAVDAPNGYEYAALFPAPRRPAKREKATKP